MALRKKYPNRRLPYKARTRKTNAARKRTTTGLKKMVRREIARNIENKNTQYLGTSKDIIPSNSPGFDGNIFPVTPHGSYLQINWGNTPSSRVGNKIKIKNLKMGGVIFPLSYNSVSNVTPCPCQVKVWFFYDKTDGTAIPTPQGSADFLQYGSSSLALQNNLFDHSMPINTDRYRVLTTRTFKVGYSTYLGTGAQPQQGNFSNNDFKLNTKFNINLTKYCIKNLTYRDNVSTPTQRGIYCMFQPIYANGNPMSASTIPVRAEFMLDCTYEDA